MKAPFKLSIFLLLLISTFSCIAQNRVTDTSATCIAFWKNGEHRILQITHEKEKYDSTKLKSKTSVAYEAHIKIVDSTTNSFTIEWVSKNFRSSDLNEQSLVGVNTIMEGLKIIYKTNDLGSFSELLNWQEVRDFYFNILEKSLSSNSENKETNTALNQVKAMFQSKESIEAVLIREIQLYHTPYGTEYTLSGETIETALANISEGPPFPAKINFKIDELDKKKNICRVSIKQAVDKGKAGPIIADMLKKLSSSGNIDDAEMKKQINDMEITDVNEFTYFISTGWLSRVYFQRKSSVGIITQIERYEINEKK